MNPRALPDSALHQAARPVLLAALLALICIGAASPLAWADRSGQAQQELQQVRQRIQSIKQDVESKRNRRDALSRALAEVEEQIGSLGRRLHALRKEIDDRRDIIAGLDVERREAEARIGDRLDGLRGQLREVYMNGQQSKLRVLLSQDNPQALGRMMAWYDYFSEAQIEGIALLRSQASELLATREKIARQQDALQADETRLQNTLAALKDSESSREAALREAEEQLARRGRSLKTLEGDEQRLENLIGSLQKQLAKVDTTSRTRPLGDYKGSLIRPLNGRELAGFGQRKPGSNLRWQGLWLAAGNGSPVRAAAAGRVVYAGWMHRYGLIAVLDHGNNFYTLYGHAQAIYPEIGDWVQAGETIAAAGNSGGHRQTGIYFEIRQGKKPLNPASWLPRG